MKNCRFYDFIGGNWRWLLLVNLLFVTAYLVLIFGLDIEFYYSIFNTDPFLYYIKGYQFATQHNFDARLAENLPPFQYVSMPGIIRYPAYILSGDFDEQLRIMQVGNVLILACVGLLFSYYLHAVLPVEYSIVTFTLPYIYLGISSAWQVNAFVPMSDSLFALFSVSAMVRIRSAEFSEKVDGKMALSMAITAFFVFIAITLKYYGISLVAFAYAAWKSEPVNNYIIKYLSRLGIAAVACIAILFYYQFSTFQLYYSTLARAFHSSSLIDILLPLVSVSIPEQIVPNYKSFFASFPFFSSNLLSSPRNIILTTAGISITSIIIYGAYLARSRFFPEIVFIATILPIVGIFSDNTPRYLGSCQMLFWIFFIFAFQRMVKMAMPQFQLKANAKVFIFAFLIIFMSVAALLRISIMSHRNSVGTLHAHQVFFGTARIYRNLHHFLGSLPTQTTRLLLLDGDGGKWQAISRFTYYSPDKSLVDLVGKYNFYVVFDNNKRDNIDMSLLEKQTLASLKEYGNFIFVKIYSEKNQFAEAEVYKVEIEPSH